MRVIIVRFARSDLNYQLSYLKNQAPLYLEAFTKKNKSILFNNFLKFNNWYTRVLGLDEVKLYQERVVALQERLLTTQDKRREVGRHLAEVRKKSNFLQDEIHKVKRQDDLEKFLILMREETEVLKLEREISNNFQEYDQAERELFTAFSNSIRDSHEKQRAQLEYTKYFGIVLSIAGSFLAFCYTSMNKSDLKHFIEQVLEQKTLDRDSFTELVRNEFNELNENQRKMNESWVQFLNSGQVKKDGEIFDQPKVTFIDNQTNEVKVWYIIGGLTAIVVLGKLIF